MGLISLLISANGILEWQSEGLNKKQSTPIVKSEHSTPDTIRLTFFRSKDERLAPALIITKDAKKVFWVAYKIVSIGNVIIFAKPREVVKEFGVKVNIALIIIKITIIGTIKYEILDIVLNDIFIITNVNINTITYISHLEHIGKYI